MMMHWWWTRKVLLTWVLLVWVHCWLVVMKGRKMTVRWHIWSAVMMPMVILWLLAKIMLSTGPDVVSPASLVGDLPFRA